jgi:hypothetical protein
MEEMTHAFENRVCTAAPSRQPCMGVKELVELPKFVMLDKIDKWLTSGV